MVGEARRTPRFESSGEEEKLKGGLVQKKAGKSLQNEQVRGRSPKSTLGL